MSIGETESEGIVEQESETDGEAEEEAESDTNRGASCVHKQWTIRYQQIPGGTTGAANDEHKPKNSNGGPAEERQGGAVPYPPLA